MPNVLRAMTPVATMKKPRSTSAIIDRRPTRPLLLAIRLVPRLPPGSQLGAACARIALDLRFRRCHRPPGNGDPERASATGADDLLRRTHTICAPIPERMLHDAVFTRVVRDDGENSVRVEPVTQRRQRPTQPLDLVV